jgi:CelD/BcsL family acetyltransferase involved in cellulose biosynthesis
MAPQLRGEWAFDDEALAALDDAWDALAELSPNPFAHSDWLLPWWRAFGRAPVRPAVLRISRQDELVAGLPMLATPHRLVAMANTHTPVFAPLFSDDAALESLAAAVVRTNVGRISIGPLDREGAASGGLACAARGSGRIAVRESTYVSPIVDTTGSFEAYRADRRGGWKTLERRGRKAAREHRLETRLIEVPTDGVGFLEEGLRVEASGWKGESSTAILSRPETAHFYRDVAAGFARRRALALSGLWLDGRLAAFDLALLHANRYWMLKTGYDEDFRHLTPGLVLRRAVVERCFDAGLETHELLGADHPWKRLFSSSERAHCTCHCFRRLPVPLAEFTWRRARPGLRWVYRRLRSATGA